MYDINELEQKSLIELEYIAHKLNLDANGLSKKRIIFSILDHQDGDLSPLKPSLPKITPRSDSVQYADEKHSLPSLLENDQGYIIGRIGDQLLRFKTDAHLLTSSPTGGGKGTGCIIPNLLDHTGSCFVIDIRGETVAKTANAKRLQGHEVVILDPYDLTKGVYGADSYNPFDRLKSFDNTYQDDLIQRLVSALMFDPSGRMSNEPIWDNATKLLLSGLITFLVRYQETFKHNLLELINLVNGSQNDHERLIAELQSLIENDEEASDDQYLKSLFKLLTDAKDNTKIADNAMVQAQTLLSWIGNKSFRNILEYSTFSFSDMQSRPMVVYIVVPEEYIENCAVWVRVMIESAIFSIKDVNETFGTNTKDLDQSKRILFLLDELPVFGQLDVISKGMATLRGRGINLWLFIQNLSQLDDIYGEHKARTIIGNVSVQQAFQTSELKELEYFTQLIGEEFFDIQSIAIQESTTEGSSATKGKSHTVGNSESVTKTTGTADTTAEAVSTNWSEAIGSSWSKAKTKSKQKSKQKNYSSSTGSAKTKTKNTGKSKGEGTSNQRNHLGGGSVKSDNRNTSDNTGKGSSRTRNTNNTEGGGTTTGWSSAETDTTGGQETNTKGGGHSNTTSHTTNESTGHTNQSSISDTTSESETTNQSNTYGRTVTIKPERLKLETIRTLRDKMNANNQLLAVRGLQPFFTPKMAYFQTFKDEDIYMFPDFMVMTCLNKLSELFMIKNEEYAKYITDLKDIACEIEKNSAFELCIDYNNRTWKNFNKRDLRTFPEFIIKANSIIDNLINLNKKYVSHTSKFDELMKVLKILLTVFSNTLEGGDFWIQKLEQLSELKFVFDKNCFKGIKKRLKIKDFLELPIMELNQMGDSNYYDIYEGEESWYVKTYHKAIRDLGENLLLLVNQRIQEKEEENEVLEYAFDLLQSTPNLIEQSINIRYQEESDIKEKFVSI